MALANAIQSFDGSQVQAGTITGSALATTANPNTLLAATTFPFVSSGCVWSTVSGLSGGMTGGTIYYNGMPIVVNSIASHTFTASQDTYVDIDVNGNVTYQGVTNNSASPSITANSIRVAIVVTGASAITFVNIGQTNTALSGFAPVASGVYYTVCDSLGNLIYPTDPSRSILGYRQIIGGTITTTSTSVIQIVGLNVPVIVPTGRKVKISVFSPSSYVNATANGFISIWDGAVGSGTQLQQSTLSNSAVNQQIPSITESLTLPGTANKTYNVGYFVTSGTGNFTNVSTNPAYIKVELE